MKLISRNPIIVRFKDGDMDTSVVLNPLLNKDLLDYIEDNPGIEIGDDIVLTPVGDTSTYISAKRVLLDFSKDIHLTTPPKFIVIDNPDI